MSFKALNCSIEIFKPTFNQVKGKMYVIYCCRYFYEGFFIPIRSGFDWSEYSVGNWSFQIIHRGNHFTGTWTIRQRTWPRYSVRYYFYLAINLIRFCFVLCVHLFNHLFNKKNSIGAFLCRFGKVLIVQDVDDIDPVLLPILRNDYILQG